MEAEQWMYNELSRMVEFKKNDGRIGVVALIHSHNQRESGERGKLIASVPEMLKKIEERDSVIKSMKFAVELMEQELKEQNSIVKSLKIANEEKDRVNKKMISENVERRMHGVYDRTFLHKNSSCINNE